jgi:hypothetical protein
MTSSVIYRYLRVFYKKCYVLGERVSRPVFFTSDSIGYPMKAIAVPRFPIVKGELIDMNGFRWIGQRSDPVRNH